MGSNVVTVWKKKQLIKYRFWHEQYFTKKQIKIPIKSDLICCVKVSVVELQLFLTCYRPKSEVKL